MSKTQKGDHYTRSKSKRIHTEDFTQCEFPRKKNFLHRKRSHLIAAFPTTARKVGKTGSVKMRAKKRSPYKSERSRK